MNHVLGSIWSGMQCLSNQSEWGTAQIKIFFLVDRGFLTRAANSGVNPTEWGENLGRNFRYFCEKSPIVSVRRAAQQTYQFNGIVHRIVQDIA